MKFKSIEEEKEVMVIQPSKIKLPDGTVQDQSYMWKGQIVKMVEGSRTKVIVKDIERGPGWHEDTRSYKGVNIPNGWYRGQNHGYGDDIEVHIKYLNELNEVEIPQNG